MNKILHTLRYHWLLRQWKKRSKKKRRSNIHVGRLKEFFAALDARGIAYVLLRWFDEVPLTSQEEKDFTEDIDILAESSQLEEFCRVLAAFPGKIKMDLYSNGIRLATDCKRIAYFPPVLGSELLAERVQHKGHFYCPSPRLHLYSLLYHCVYQKGLLCGLPTGTALPNPETYSRDLIGELSRVAAQAGETLPEPINLLNIHHWLQQRDWAMPYDLLGRWPKRNAWHEELLKLETEKQLKDLGKLKDILVFLIREDAVNCGADKAIVEALREKFTILEQLPLDAEQQRRVMRETRGGDWTKHKDCLIVPPVIAVVCHDPAPQPIAQESTLGAIHKFVSNANVFCKHEIRRRLEGRFPSAINFMHGSDNDPESMAYLKAIHGKSWPEKIVRWQKMI